MSNKDWMDYANLAANIHQSIKLGEISNQLDELNSINKAMLGNMNNLVDIEVYKLEKEENEKHFKQLLFNLKKFLKTKYEEPLTVALLNVGHTNVLNALLKSFQEQLTSFDDKEYVEEIIDGFNQYSEIEIDYKSLGEKDEDGVALLLSYLMINDNICAIDDKLQSSNQDIDKIRGEYITPMKTWTFESFNEHLAMIGAPQENYMLESIPPVFEESKTENDRIKFSLYAAIKRADSLQVIFDKEKRFKDWLDLDSLSKADEIKNMGFFKRKLYSRVPKFVEEKNRIENEILPSLLKGSINKSDDLSMEIKSSMNSLSNDLKNSNAEWINVEKNLLNIMYDTTLLIQGPYQYRKQVIGE